MFRRARHPLLFVAVLAVAALAACTKSESGAPAPSVSATPALTTSSATTPLPSASAAPSAVLTDDSSASPTALKEAADAGRAAGDVRKDAAGSVSPPAASGSGAPAECGTKPLPDCPLQAWMKANANPPVMTSDLPALASALDKMGPFAPPGYSNWASIAKDGAAAARGGDLTAAKAACRSCHDQYKQKYKAEHRARKI